MLLEFTVFFHLSFLVFFVLPPQTLANSDAWAKTIYIPKDWWWLLWW